MVMGTSLSGLTIDMIAHKAGAVGTPRLVFDVTPAPVESLRRGQRGGWTDGRDCFLQGSLDESVLHLCYKLGWLGQLFDYLPHLCHGSLSTLRGYVSEGCHAKLGQRRPRGRGQGRLCWACLTLRSPA
jgi:hypothetical protein